MAEQHVLIAYGDDRPGVIDELSEFLLKAGGNITDSQAVNLAGQFSMLLLVRGEPRLREAILSKADQLQSQGIHIELRPARQAESAASFPYRFTASGKDRAGVINRISHLLRALNVNIDAIQTRVAPGGAFQLQMHLAVPRTTPASMLRDYLRVLCEELGFTGELMDA